MTKSTGVGRGKHLSPERRLLLARAVEDGWPIRQIILTYGIGTSTVKKHYPDYCGISLVEGGELSMAIQKADLKIQRSTAQTKSETQRVC